MIDALPFLSLGADEEHPIMFSSEQTYELMHCLQELTADSTLPKKQQLMIQEHEAQLRMQLARNLSNALMFEGDDNSA